MNWEAIGALGEILGAAAVVMTLAYLAAQLRQNTRALRSSTFQEINTGMSRTSEIFATSPDLCLLLLKAQDGLSSLTAGERVRLSFAMVMTMRRLHAVHVQRELGAVSDDFTTSFERSVISVIVGSPGVREWWSSSSHAFPPDFVSRVERLITGPDPDRPSHVGLGTDGQGEHV